MRTSNFIAANVLISVRGQPMGIGIAHKQLWGRFSDLQLMDAI